MHFPALHRKHRECGAQFQCQFGACVSALWGGSIHRYRGCGLSYFYLLRKPAEDTKKDIGWIIPHGIKWKDTQCKRMDSMRRKSNVISQLAARQRANRLTVLLLKSDKVPSYAGLMGKDLKGDSGLLKDFTASRNQLCRQLASLPRLKVTFFWFLRAQTARLCGNCSSAVVVCLFVFQFGNVGSKQSNERERATPL